MANVTAALCLTISSRVDGFFAVFEIGHIAAEQNMQGPLK